MLIHQQHLLQAGCFQPLKALQFGQLSTKYLLAHCPLEPMELFATIHLLLDQAGLDHLCQVSLTQ